MVHDVQRILLNEGLQAVGSLHEVQAVPQQTDGMPTLVDDALPDEEKSKGSASLAGEDVLGLCLQACVGVG